ncbi:hypothetical protein ACTID9_15285 [Brevibacillus fluminis]|uniref:hypothetical protein n=1 Tax=Brevibacillus fluminis TaxID=511487 RepID=UPI003F88A6FB
MMRRSDRKKRKQTRLNKWITIFLVLSLVQIGGLYGMDQFLQPSSISASGNNQGNQEPAKTILIPKEATVSAYSPDGKHLAYVQNDGTFVVADEQGIVYSKQAEEIPHFQWLGNTSLLFFAQDNSLRAYLLQVHGAGTETQEPVMIQRWSGKETKVEQVDFSPYLEYLYIMVKRGDDKLLYRYSAGEGLNRIALGSLKLESVTYDDKTDVLTLYMTDGSVYRYEKRRLYDAAGKIVREDPSSEPQSGGKNQYEPNSVGKK